MSFQLRDYQKQIITDAYNFFKSGIKSLMIYAPTGSGKTCISAQIMADCVSRGQRVLFLVHRVRLAFQAQKTLQKVGIDSGIIWGDYPTNPKAPVQIAMVQTLQRRQLPPNIKLVVLDECHTTAYFEIFRRVLDFYSNGILPLSPCFFIGLSGSPWRAKHNTEGFCQFFQAIVRSPDIDELTKAGYLVPSRRFGWNGLADFSVLDTKEGEFTEKSMRKVCTKDLNRQIVQIFKSTCPDRKPIAFCGSTDQAYDLAKQFNDAGIAAETIVGEIPEEVRDKSYARYEDSTTQLLSSVGCLTEGFDVTSCDAVILARPINSLALLIQACGRSLRLHEGKKDALLLDFCENFTRKGRIKKKPTISLCPGHRPITIPVKECPQCHGSVLNFSRICPECSFEFPLAQKKLEIQDKSEVTFGELLSPDEMVQCNFLRSHLLRAYKSQRDILRIDLKFQKRFQCEPPRHWYLNAIFRRGKDSGFARRKIDEQYLKKHIALTQPKADKWMVCDALSKEFGFKYDLEDLRPLKWWIYLGFRHTTVDWEAIKISYLDKLAIADIDEAEFLNLCFDEAKAFHYTMRGGISI